MTLKYRILHFIISWTNSETAHTKMKEAENFAGISLWKPVDGRQEKSCKYQRYFH